MLAIIVFALQKFHYYLWGNHFTLFTDHRALTFLLTHTEMNSMLVGWQDVILAYTFNVVYRPGVLKILPDALSASSLKSYGQHDPMRKHL